MRTRKLGVFLAGMIVLAHGRSSEGAVTIECLPIDGTAVTGAQTLVVECYLSTDVEQGFGQTQLDLACTLPGRPGSSGSITKLSLLVDTGHQAPPYLFSPDGLGPVDTTFCKAAGAPPLGLASITASAGTYYLVTITYRVSDCATGDFDVVLENFSKPPQPLDQTRLRDESNELIPFSFTPTTLTVEVGSCCDGSICLGDGLNEFCCRDQNPGAVFGSGRTCADEDPCGCHTTGDCDDGDPCNGQETCNPDTGDCQTGVAPDCDDGNACTMDRCDNSHPDADPVTGCLHEAADDGTPCDDGNDCTADDRCTLAACTGTPVVVLFGDVVPPGGNGIADIDDLLCVLAGFADAAECPDGDLAPCGGNGVIDIDDVLVELLAFAGEFACPHPCPP